MSTEPEASPPVVVVAARKPRLWTLVVGVLFSLVAVLFTTAASLLPFFVRFVKDSQRAGILLTPDAIGQWFSSFVFTTTGLLASALGSALAFGCTALLVGALSPEPIADRLRLRHAPRWVPVGLCGLLQLMGFGMLASQTAVLLGLSERGTLPLIRRALAHPSPAHLACAALIVGFGAGFAEELYFRGFLQSRLERRAPAWAAIVLSALAFGIAHADPVHSSFAFLVGLAQGWSACRTGSIRSAMVAHTLNNLLGVAGMAVDDGTPETRELWQLAVGALLVGAGTYGVARLTRPTAGSQAT